RATKSVSELISTKTPRRPPGAIYWAMTPSLASRVALETAVAAPFLRKRSPAALRSPLASMSAFLQSIRPAPVISRSFATEAAEISDIKKLTVKSCELIARSSKAKNRAGQPLRLDLGLL